MSTVARLHGAGRIHDRDFTDGVSRGCKHKHTEQGLPCNARPCLLYLDGQPSGSSTVGDGTSVLVPFSRAFLIVLTLAAVICTVASTTTKKAWSSHCYLCM